jgi:uncharacterized protein YuzE
MARRERIFRPNHEEQTMKLHLDPQADALYLRLDDSKIIESEEVSPGIVLDFNESGEVVGVEMLHLSNRTSKIRWNALEFETASQIAG